MLIAWFRYKRSRHRVTGCAPTATGQDATSASACATTASDGRRFGT